MPKIPKVKNNLTLQRISPLPTRLYPTKLNNKYEENDIYLFDTLHDFNNYLNNFQTFNIDKRIDEHIYNLKSELEKKCEKIIQSLYSIPISTNMTYYLLPTTDGYDNYIVVDVNLQNLINHFVNFFNFFSQPQPQPQPQFKYCVIDANPKAIPCIFNTLKEYRNIVVKPVITVLSLCDSAKSGSRKEKGEIKLSYPSTKCEISGENFFTSIDNVYFPYNYIVPEPPISIETLIKPDNFKFILPDNLIKFINCFNRHFSSTDTTTNNIYYTTRDIYVITSNYFTYNRFILFYSEKKNIQFGIPDPNIIQPKSLTSIVFNVFDVITNNIYQAPFSADGLCGVPVNVLIECINKIKNDPRISISDETFKGVLNLNPIINGILSNNTNDNINDNINDIIKLFLDYKRSGDYEQVNCIYNLKSQIKEQPISEEDIFLCTGDRLCSTYAQTKNINNIFISFSTKSSMWKYRCYKRTHSELFYNSYNLLEANVIKTLIIKKFITKWLSIPIQNIIHNTYYDYVNLIQYNNIIDISILTNIEKDINNIYKINNCIDELFHEIVYLNKLNNKLNLIKTILIKTISGSTNLSTRQIREGTTINYYIKIFKDNFFDMDNKNERIEYIQQIYNSINNINIHTTTIITTITTITRIQLLSIQSAYFSYLDDDVNKLKEYIDLVKDKIFIKDNTILHKDKKLLYDQRDSISKNINSIITNILQLKKTNQIAKLFGNIQNAGAGSSMNPTSSIKNKLDILTKYYESIPYTKPDDNEVDGNEVDDNVENSIQYPTELVILEKLSIYLSSVLVENTIIDYNLYVNFLKIIEHKDNKTYIFFKNNITNVLYQMYIQKKYPTHFKRYIHNKQQQLSTMKIPSQISSTISSTISKETYEYISKFKKKNIILYVHAIYLYYYYYCLTNDIIKSDSIYSKIFDFIITKYNSEVKKLIKSSFTSKSLFTEEQYIKKNAIQDIIVKFNSTITKSSSKLGGGKSIQKRKRYTRRKSKNYKKKLSRKKKSKSKSKK